MNVTALSLYNGTLLCGTNAHGIFIYQNNQWSSDETGIICSAVTSMTGIDSVVVASGRNEVYRSDTSDSWKIISPGTPHDSWAWVRTMGSTVVLSVEHDTASFPYDIPYILTSTNHGGTWNYLIDRPPFAGDDPYGIYCFNGRLYAYENEKLFYTDDDGLNWTDISIPSQFCNGIYGFAIFDSVPFASACGNGQLLRLSNNTWSLSNIGLPATHETNAIFFCQGALFTYVTYAGVYASLDHGNSWSPANTGLPQLQGILDFAWDHSNVIIATAAGVFYSDNLGQNWQALNDGLINRFATSLVLLNDTLFAGTNGNGIWKLPLVDIGLDVNEAEKQETLAVFPNPVHARATISAGHHLQDASLTLVNCFGQVVKEINHLSGDKVVIECSDLASGIYLLHLTDLRETWRSKVIVVGE